MNILSIGWFSRVSNTSLHRHWALEKNAKHIDAVDLGNGKTSLWFKIAYHLFQKGLPIKLPDATKANRKIKQLVSENKYDLIWIDKGVTVKPSTLKFIKLKLPNCKLVSYSPDNMALRHNQSQQYLDGISVYDAIFTNKSYIIEDLKGIGAKNVFFIHNMYEETFHYPRELTLKDKEYFGCDIGFVGAWEKERFESIKFLVKKGLQVKVFGDGEWKNYRNYAPNLTILPSIFSENYCKALQSFKISLCFLRKKNFDQQTTRTMESINLSNLSLTLRF